MNSVKYKNLTIKLFKKSLEGKNQNLNQVFNYNI